MMDLGATICTPKRPACALCPFNADCLALKHHDPQNFPVKAPKKEKPVRQGAAFVAVSADGTRLFTANGPSGEVAVIDTATYEVKDYLLVGQRVWHMAFTPDEKFLLSTNGLSNDVSVIDVASLKVIKTIQVGELPWGITISRE
jgi:YVTN family beta-propeller protein